MLPSFVTLQGRLHKEEVIGEFAKEQGRWISKENKGYLGPMAISMTLIQDANQCDHRRTTKTGHFP